MELNKYSEQLKTLLDVYSENSKDTISLDEVDKQSLVTSSIAAINRITGKKSVYSKEVKRLLTLQPDFEQNYRLILGVLKGLKFDIDKKFFQPPTETK